MNPIEIGAVKSANPPPQQGVHSESHTFGVAPHEQVYQPPQTIPVAPTLPVQLPVPNKYAPTGWRKKVSIEFDLHVPSGQVCRIRRLETNDVFRLKILDHLDQFLPMLLDDKLDDQQRDEKIQNAVKNNTHLIDDLYGVVDIVVMACCLKPAITANVDATYYGTEADWGNPDFLAIVHIDDIDLMDRMAIFEAAFGAESAGLKSFFQQKASVEPVQSVQDVHLPTESVS